MGKKQIFTDEQIEALITEVKAMREKLRSTPGLIFNEQSNALTPEEIEDEIGILAALHVMEFAHKGQVRHKSGGLYIEHTLDVGGAQNDRKNKQAGYMHDVCEDSNITLEHLRRMGFHEEVVETVGVLTCPEGMGDVDHIVEVARHPRARKIKIADRRSNMRDARIFKDPPSVKKYSKIAGYPLTLAYLTGVDEQFIEPGRRFSSFLFETDYLGYIQNMPSENGKEIMNLICNLFMFHSSEQNWILPMSMAINRLNLPTPPKYKSWFPKLNDSPAPAPEVKVA